MVVVKKEKKIKTFLVATNVVASRAPERRPTATPTARAKNYKTLQNIVKRYKTFGKTVKQALTVFFNIIGD